MKRARNLMNAKSLVISMVMTYMSCKISNPRLKLGDTVRITKKKTIFDKGHMPRWTEEIFRISQAQHTDPPTHKISDTKGEEIQGAFYEQELQRTTQEVFTIEKVIRRRGNKSLVKWLGYPDSFDSWVDNKDLKPLR